MKWDAEVSAAVAQAAHNYGVAVDPALVHAVIEKETHHGALPITGTVEPGRHVSYGPMQVKDTTALMHGITDPSTLATPSIGIRIGTFELARLLRLFSGDTPRAVSGYNAGAGNATRNATGKFPNQTYVDDVLGYWRSYGPAIAGVAVLLVALAIGALIYLHRTSRRRLAD